MVSVLLAEADSEKKAIVLLVVADSERAAIVLLVVEVDSEKVVIDSSEGQDQAAHLDPAQNEAAIFQAHPVKTGGNPPTRNAPAGKLVPTIVGMMIAAPIAIGVQVNAASQSLSKSDLPTRNAPADRLGQVVHSDRDQNAQAIFQARPVKTGEHVPTGIGRMIAAPIAIGGPANAVSQGLLKKDQDQAGTLIRDQRDLETNRVIAVKTNGSVPTIVGMMIGVKAVVGISLRNLVDPLDNQKIVVRGSARRKCQSVMARFA